MSITTITFNNLFVFSELRGCCFYSDFNSGANIVSGRNTSGKSTLIQSLLYSFGINDVKEGLSEILDYKPTFRVDFTKEVNGIYEKYSIIREPNNIYIKEHNGKITPFYGINFDHSAEHIRLKDHIRSLVGFTLYLEQGGELKSASLECMFLPYYISQSVGWVYLSESFSGFQFYRGFKDDYLDYYLGVENNFDRSSYRELIRKRDRLSSNIRNLNQYSKSEDFQYSRIIDESLGKESEEYIESYIKQIDSLEKEKIKQIKICNEISVLQNHQTIIRRTKRSISKQKYNNIDKCPACAQTLAYSIQGLYGHYQKYNDTVKLESHVTDLLKSKQSNLNSINNAIIKNKKNIEESYSILLAKNIGEITFEKWIASKANSLLYKKIKNDIETMEIELESIKEEINGMSTEERILEIRKNKETLFRKLFLNYTAQLNLKNLTESRYIDLYSINSFPRHGVELHKTIMAYHFALNTLIKSSNSAHRLPFLLDAILKEDIDDTNLQIILSFVGRNLPTDTQSFISISEHVKTSEDIDSKESIKKIDVKKAMNSYFPSETKLIYIGDGTNERSFLSQSLEEYSEHYQDTMEIMSI